MRSAVVLFAVSLRLHGAYATGVRRSVIVGHTGKVGAPPVVVAPPVVRRANRSQTDADPDPLEHLHDYLGSSKSPKSTCPPAVELQKWISSRTRQDFPDGLNKIEQRWERDAMLSFACALYMANATHDIADAGVFVVVIDKLQACSFDNWVSSLTRIPSWRYPVIAVEIGNDVHEVCEQVKKQARGQNVWLECVQNRPQRVAALQEEFDSSQSPVVVHRPQFPDYLQTGWAKVDILEFVMRLGFRIFLSDLDNVFLKDPHTALADYFHSKDMVTLKESHRNNLGLLIGNPDSYFGMVQWTTTWAALDGSSTSRQKGGRRHLKFLPEDRFISRCGCPKNDVLPDSAVSVHMRCVRNSSACLKTLQLWRPQGVPALPMSECDGDHGVGLGEAAWRAFGENLIH